MRVTDDEDHTWCKKHPPRTTNGTFCFATRCVSFGWSCSSSSSSPSLCSFLERDFPSSWSLVVYSLSAINSSEHLLLYPRSGTLFFACSSPSSFCYFFMAQTANGRWKRDKNKSASNDWWEDSLYSALAAADKVFSFFFAFSSHLPLLSSRK